MLREEDSPHRQIEKLLRINQALAARLDRIENARSSTYALSRTAAVLEKEVMARNRDLERTLAELGTINRELDTAREMAEEANRAKSRFLRAASHDLLQPLSAAKLFLSHLADLLRDPAQAEVVGRINTAFDSAEELIRALLDISRLDSRALEVTPEPVDLGQLLLRLAVDFEGQARARGLDLRCVPSSAIVESSPVYLRSIAQNLLSNAIKYTPQGRILVGVRRARGMFALEVHDTGPGIAAHDRDRIFNEFERLDPQGSIPGSGLGLSIVRRACNRFGHELDLRSRPGTGSCFRVWLPPARDAAPLRLVPPQQRGVAGMGAGAALRGRRAMVVENDTAMRGAYVLLMQGWGMQVAAAAGTDAALGLLAQGPPPDILLSDYQLDRGDTGLRTIRAFRDRLGDLPALLVTAERAPFLVAQARGLAVQVLEKPVAEPVLQQAILTLLEHRP
ncbi:hybrid sensor histidine kinase/response regulator [Halodurantibacterium flavum]|uniref:histidine kinase n=1 Tax=Halodurantibacterium flavum TaxID=1382802 RepID=A0ABW4SBJ3_9RHOB